MIQQLHNKVEQSHVHSHKGISPFLHSSGPLGLQLDF